MNSLIFPKFQNNQNDIINLSRIINDFYIKPLKNYIYQYFINKIDNYYTETLKLLKLYDIDKDSFVEKKLGIIILEKDFIEIFNDKYSNEIFGKKINKSLTKYNTITIGENRYIFGYILVTIKNVFFNKDYIVEDLRTLENNKENCQMLKIHLKITNNIMFNDIFIPYESHINICFSKEPSSIFSYDYKKLNNLHHIEYIKNYHSDYSKNILLFNKSNINVKLVNIYYNQNHEVIKVKPYFDIRIKILLNRIFPETITEIIISYLL
jgi:hypothetical protein